jgi:LacI family transcriptional regulator, gluconate utilization system Gnt-I transcriptional repressor
LDQRSGDVTIEDVARRAEVSLMTVSRTLRQPELVAAKTRERVFSAIKELGYVPNAMASGMRSKTSNTVAMLIPNMKNPLFSATAHGIMQQLRARKISVLISDVGYSVEDEERVIAGLLTRRPNGLVLHSTTHSQNTRDMLRRSGIPVIETGDLCEDPIDCVVSYSNEQAGYVMTEHLLNRGYTNIGFVSLRTRGNERAMKRRAGHLRALREAGVEPLPENLIETEPGYHAGARTLVALMERRPRVDAVFFSGDVHAIGAVLECNRRGWSIPGDIAIAGFDDYDIAEHIYPSLTTLTIPRVEIGERAGELILNRIDGLSRDKVVLNLGFSLSIRSST